MGELGHGKLASRSTFGVRSRQAAAQTMRLKLILPPTSAGGDAKKIFKLPEAAASIGDLLEAIKLAFSLGEDSRMLTCSSLDGFDMEPWLAAWEVLERDMKLKVEWKRACVGQEPAVQKQQQQHRSGVLQTPEASEAGGEEQEARGEESPSAGLAAGQEQQQLLDMPQVPKESVAGGAQQEARPEASLSGGLGDQPILAGEKAGGLQGLPAPRPAGQMETRSCSGCKVVGNIDLFGGAGWGNPHRKCSRCWAQGRRGRKEEERKLQEAQEQGIKEEQQ